MWRITKKKHPKTKRWLKATIDAKTPWDVEPSDWDELATAMKKIKGGGFFLLWDGNRIEAQLIEPDFKKMNTGDRARLEWGGFKFTFGKK